MRAQRIRLALAAVERHTVDLAQEVDDHHVAGVGGMAGLGGLGGIVLSGDRLQRVLDLFVAGRRDRALDGDRSEIHDLDIGQRLDGDGEFQVLALVRRP